jgi:hypothetical protein
MPGSNGCASGIARGCSRTTRPCYVSGELSWFLESRRMEHTRGAPCRPMTEGKIKRYHRSMKNRVQLQNYAYPWDLEGEIARFAECCNHQCYHESPGIVTPADVWSGRAREAQSRREGSNAERWRCSVSSTHRGCRQPPDRRGRRSACQLGAMICLTLADTIHIGRRSLCSHPTGPAGTDSDDRGRTPGHPIPGPHPPA